MISVHNGFAFFVPIRSRLYNENDIGVRFSFSSIVTMLKQSSNEFAVATEITYLEQNVLGNTGREPYPVVNF